MIHIRPGLARLLLCVIPVLGWAFAPTLPVPPHEKPWIEIKKPGLHTVFLWKFSSQSDASRDVDDLLQGGSVDDLLSDAGGTAAAVTFTRDRPEPRLHLDARTEADTGRFGGGLVLDGTGYISTDAPLPSLLKSEGGFTLDFWFRIHEMPDGSIPLLILHDVVGQPLLMVSLDVKRSLSLKIDNTERLQVPLNNTADDWHHLALIISAPRGHPDFSALSLTLDGHQAEVKRPEPSQPIPWFKGIPARLGNRLIIGGSPDAEGFRGVVDEVRLSPGRLYLYPWHFGTQTKAADDRTTSLEAPYFRKNTILTRFSFDGTLEPEPYGGRSWEGKAAETHFRAGISGQALDLSQIDQTGFTMTGFYAFPDNDGSIEFWFRPLDWHNFYLGEYDGRDVPFYHLLTLHAKDARYGMAGTPTKNIEIFRGRASKNADLLWERFHPGTWTHVLISRDGGKQTVYVNGRQQKQWQAGYVIQGHPFAQEPLKAWRERTGGDDIDDTWTWRFKPSPTLVDELTVYARSMSAEEAWNAYARWLPKEIADMKPLPTLRISFDYFAHSWNLEDKLTIKVACLPVNEVPPASADCELRNSEGNILLTVAKQPLGEGSNTTFTLKQPLEFGRYPVTIRSRDAAGNILKEERLEYVREKPEWLGNTLGEERTVPEPWTPITVDGDNLNVIGRRIELGANGLPRRIETLNQSVLAAPATLRSSGAALAGQGMTMTESAPDRVAWQARSAGAGLVADIQAWMEFDGLIYTTVTLTPAEGDNVEVIDLDVDFPLNPEIVTQLLANGGGNDFRASWIARYIPDGEGSVWNSLDKPYPAFVRAHGLQNYMPHIWLGGDLRGVYFGAENDQGWTVNAETPAQEIIRQDGAVTFRMNVIREPMTVTAEGHRFHFIILPTPAKPEPVDWREQMLGGVNFASVDTFGGFDLKGNPADPTPADPFKLEPYSWEYAAQQAKGCREKYNSGICILYTDASWPQPGPAYRDWNHDLHAGTGRLAWTPEFEDYAVWAINQFLERGLIDGVYWDDVSVGYTYSLASTAYQHAGSENGRRVGFTMMAQRRANLRLWRLFQAAGKEPMIWAHMTVCYEVPIFSFCRYLSNCEFVTGVDFPGQRDAMDMWSPETLRLLGGSAKWGTGYHALTTLPRQLPDTAAAKQWLYPQARAEDALYLTNDIMQLSNNLRQKLNQEDIFAEQVTAYPWWKADSMVRVAAPEDADVRAAVYAQGDRVVVVVANHDREPREVSIDLVHRADGVIWRDLDPGLQPPEQVAASAEEIQRAGSDSGLPDEKPLDEVAVMDLLEGATPESRATAALELRVTAGRATVLIRPRDYRILEARTTADANR